jgi:serine/threonine-protein kinase
VSNNQNVRQAGEYICRGRYMVEKIIKGGGMSHVYQVREVNLKQVWCAKEIMHGVTDKDRMEEEALISEAYIMKSLNNPSIPRIVSIEKENNCTYIIMDYVTGQNLQDFIVEHGPLSVELATQYMMQLCEVVAYLHKKAPNKPAILYRDLKPLNIMVCPNRNLMILDFGISVVLEDEETDEHGNILDTPENRNKNRITNTIGTPGFAAPELYHKGAKYDLRSDIFSLGATFYYLLTADMPSHYVTQTGIMQGRKKAASFNPSVPAEVDAIIDKAMEPDINKRYASVLDLKVDLRYSTDFSEKHKKTVNRQLAITIILFVLSICCFISSSIPQILLHNQFNNNYLVQLEKAERTSDAQDYLAAISLKPYEIEPYLGLIDAYKVDSSFTKSEEESILDYLLPNLSQLQQQDTYGKLAYEIGILYWYYYEGDTPEISALRWFQDARDYYNEQTSTDDDSYDKDTADIYCQLGTFKKTISSAVIGSNESEMIHDYWDNLLRVNTLEKGELLELQTYSAIADCIYTYGYQLRVAGVTRDDIEAQLKQMKAYLKVASGSQRTSTKAEQLYNDLSNRMTSLEEKVKLAYDN